MIIPYSALETIIVSFNNLSIYVCYAQYASAQFNCMRNEPTKQKQKKNKKNINLSSNIDLYIWVTCEQLTNKLNQQMSTN